MQKTAVFGGGCFWCTEAIFQMLKGVSKVESGYAGGKMEKPSYEQVSNGNTGHAEVIRVTYDPAVISYEDLLTVFFGSHDPTTPNRQGADVGEQYRSIILFEDDEQKNVAKNASPRKRSRITHRWHARCHADRPARRIFQSQKTITRIILNRTLQAAVLSDRHRAEDRR